MKKVHTILLWVVSSLLALLFLNASFGKLVSHPNVLAMFRHYGYPDRFHSVVGIMELVGAVALLVPRVAAYGAVLLAVVMMGACGTHLKSGEMTRAAFTAVLVVLLGAIAYMRRRRAAPVVSDQRP